MSLKPWIDARRVEAGCDEAGRGCLAGPVTAAAVVLGPTLSKALCNEGILNDSKKLSERQRDALRIRIEEEAVAWAVSHVSPEEIDQINILQASLAGMRRSVRQLEGPVDFLLIDGNRFVTSDDMPPFECFVKGDARFASIAAASVLAKTHRDELMMNLHGKHPEYHWDSNAGYPTKQHRQAILEFGLTPWHRRSFKQLPEQMQLL